MPDPAPDKPHERLADRIGARLRREPTPRSGGNLAAFRAVEKEVAEALEEGYSIKSTWKLLREEQAVQMAYETFRDYCRSADLKRIPPTPRRRNGGDGTGSGQSPASGGVPPRTFQYNTKIDKKLIY